VQWCFNFFTIETIVTHVDWKFLLIHDKQKHSVTTFSWIMMMLDLKPTSNADHADFPYWLRNPRTLKHSTSSICHRFQLPRSRNPQNASPYYSPSCVVTQPSSDNLYWCSPNPLCLWWFVHPPTKFYFHYFREGFRTVTLSCVSARTLLTFIVTPTISYIMSYQSRPGWFSSQW